jgi:guanosine-3',5'-bis(diphosphate) 3'-pyrophosphohydrolase
MGVEMRIPTSAPGLPKTRAALEYARQRHRGQVREVDGAPFIVHPREVASLLYAAGAQDHLIAAGALHDLLEKTPVTAFDLRRRFGSTIATLVLAVSEDEHISSYTERKGALRHQVAEAGEEALMLFAADKISKARELRLEYVRPSRGAGRASTRRMTYYKRCLALLKERLPESPLVDQLDAELSTHRPAATTRRA